MLSEVERSIENANCRPSRNRAEVLELCAQRARHARAVARCMHGETDVTPSFLFLRGVGQAWEGVSEEWQHHHPEMPAHPPGPRPRWAGRVGVQTKGMRMEVVNLNNNWGGGSPGGGKWCAAAQVLTMGWKYKAAT